MTNATPGTAKVAPASPATTATFSTTESAQSTPTLLPAPKIRSAPLGAAAHAQLVLVGPISTSLEHALLWVTNVRLGTPSLDSVSAAMEATIFPMDSVTLPPSKLLRTQAALFGTPASKSASNAPKDTTSTTKNVPPWMINARLGRVLRAAAPPATMAMISSSMAPVSYRPKISLLLTMGVLTGTGLTRNVFNAQITGSSTAWEFVCLSLISAKPSTLVAVAFLVITAIT